MFHVIFPVAEDGGRPMKKGYRVMANFDSSFMAMRRREGKFSPLTQSAHSLSAIPPCDTDSDPEEQEPASLAERLPPHGCPCCAAVAPDSADRFELGHRSDDLAARAQLLKSAGGVNTGGKKRSEAEEKKAREEIAAEAKRARDRWKRLADEKKWHEVKMPLSCYRFGTKVDSDPRDSPAHVLAVLAAVGLADPKG